VRNRWLSRGAIQLHAAALVAISVMLGLGWWQLHRALHGHTQSWAYTVEWPLFAAYGGYLWWKLLHEEPGFAGRHGEGSSGAAADESPTPTPSRRARAAARAEAAARTEAEERARAAAYNEYLARLSASRRQDRR
jgi:hypothetical protein